MEPETQADGKRLDSTQEDAKIPTDTAEWFEISVYEESIDSEELEESASSPEARENEPAKEYKYENSRISFWREGENFWW